MRIKSLKWRLLIVILFVSTIPLLVLGISNYFNSKNALIEAKEAHLRDTVHGAYILAEALHQEFLAGNLTLEEAQEQFRTELLGPKGEDGTRKLSELTPILGEGDYFFAYNGEIRAVMHPKEFEGQIINEPNVDGILVNEEMYKQKEGFYQFNWINPGEDKARPKMAYIKYFEPWDWILVNGSYYDNFYKAAEALKTNAFIIITSSLLFVVIISFLFSHSIVKQISVVKSAIERMGEGDFSQRISVKSNDELGQMSYSLNQALDQVSGIIYEVSDSSEHMRITVQQIKESTNQLNSASTDIASSIEEVSTTSDRQTDRLQNVSSYMEELAASFDESSQHVSNVASLANRAKDVSEDGKVKSLAVVQQMDNIQAAMKQIEMVLGQLNTNISEIGKFTNVITEISEQTNLLALNAAIEAARAGENGRGFAIVAAEVRKLAEQSTGAAAEIEKLIINIMADSKRSNQAAEEGSHYVQAGTKSVQESTSSFDQILADVTNVSQEMHHVNQMLQEVNDGAKETASSITELGALHEEANLNTQSVASSVEEQTAMIEEMNAAMEELFERAQKLDDLIGAFKVS